MCLQGRTLSALGKDNERPKAGKTEVAVLWPGLWEPVAFIFLPMTGTAGPGACNSVCRVLLDFSKVFCLKQGGGFEYGSDLLTGFVLCAVTSGSPLVSTSESWFLSLTGHRGSAAIYLYEKASDEDR